MKFDSPDSCRQHMMACAASGDLEGAMAVYEKDSVTIMDDGLVARGIPAHHKAYAPYLRHKPQLQITVRRKIEVGDDLVVYYCDWHFEGVDETGGAIPNAGATLQVVRRQPDGSWRMVLDDHLLPSH